MLVGDSCGHNKPINGGGIVFSLLTSKHATNTIQRAFDINNFSEKMLMSYENAWKNDIGNEIKKQIIFRKIYRNMTNKDIDNAHQAHRPDISNYD